MFHAADRLLVAVMKTPQDFVLARDQGWYRVPQAHAPENLVDTAAIAFYFTAAFGEERWAIHWYAEVRGHELVRRRDLFPKAAEHPRADAVYYKIQIGPLIRRVPPIVSLRWRRITFIETTWDRFNAAQEINDLYISGVDGLYVTLKESGFFPERDYLICDEAEAYQVDLAIPCRKGTVSVVLGGRAAPVGVLRTLDPAAVQAAVERLGGARGPEDRDNNGQSIDQ